MKRRDFFRILGGGALVAAFGVRRGEAKVCEKNNALLDRIYPIGSIYISVSSVDPGGTLGGTWIKFAQGAMLAGVSSTDSDFDFRSNFQVRGAKTHILTETQMPSHTHSFNFNGNPNTSSQKYVTGTSNKVHFPVMAEGDNGVWGLYAQTGYSISRATLHPNETWFENASTGGGKAHNNLPPYITVYMWRRSA